MNLKLFTGFPLPPNYVLVCPRCNKYKMYATGDVNIFQCAAPPNICGKLTTRTEVELYKNQMITEE